MLLRSPPFTICQPQRLNMCICLDRRRRLLLLVSVEMCDFVDLFLPLFPPIPDLTLLTYRILTHRLIEIYIYSQVRSSTTRLWPVSTSGTCMRRLCKRTDFCEHHSRSKHKWRSTSPANNVFLFKASVISDKATHGQVLGRTAGDCDSYPRIIMAFCCANETAGSFLEYLSPE